MLQALRGCYARLALKVNESKTAVGLVWGRKFLGYSLRLTAGGSVHLVVAEQALDKARQRLRQITKRNAGRSMDQVVQELRRYVPGWRNYFCLGRSSDRLALDQWLRRRLRALQLHQWKRGTTVYRALRRLGAKGAVATYVARHAKRWWHCSLKLSAALDIAYFDRLGVPRFC